MKFDPNTPPPGTVRDWLDARAEAEGTAIVFPDTGEELSWRELRDRARTMAHGMAAQGIAKGESVAIIHPNGPGGVLALYATLYGGFRATMINLAAGPDAIAYALEHSGARTAFVHDTQADIFRQTAPDGLRMLDPDTAGTGGPLPDLDAGDDALLMYTSGTTGRPKGVLHSHASLLAGGWTSSLAHGLSPADRGFCVLPIYHINGLCVSMMGALISGGSLAMIPRFFGQPVLGPGR